jgi:hypothetical protein
MLRSFSKAHPALIVRMNELERTRREESMSEFIMSSSGRAGMP